MANSPTLPVAWNRNPSQPGLRDVLDTLKREIFLEMNCHAVANIQTFNPENQTATATMNYSRTQIQLNQQTNQYSAVQVPYAQLVDCPVVFLGGGYTSLTFPILGGEECLVFFNDRDLDNWFAGQPYGNGPNTTRLHSFSDGIILVGVRSAPSQLSDFDLTRAVLQDERGAKVAVGGGSGQKVLIANNTEDLNNTLSNLINALNGLCTDLTAVATALGGNPTIETAAAAGGAALTTAVSDLSANLTSVQSEIDDLLEFLP